MKNKGITLIALIITIIVMLILAGVSISLVVGDNGVITQAQTVKKVQEEATINEIILTSIVYKTTASTTLTGKYVDIPRTSVAIYKNLIDAGYDVKSDVEPIKAEDKTTELGMGIKISSDNTIEIEVESKKTGNSYTGEVNSTGISKKVAIKENEINDKTNNQHFIESYYKKFFAREGQDTYGWTFLQVNNKIDKYALDYFNSKWNIDRRTEQNIMTRDQFMEEVDNIKCQRIGNVDEILSKSIDYDVFFESDSYTDEKSTCITKEFCVFTNNYTEMYCLCYQNEDGEEIFGIDEGGHYILNTEPDFDIDDILK